MTDRREFFCHLPFVALLTDGITAAPCCKFQSKSPIPLTNYQHNLEIAEAKKLLFEGIAPPQCERCVLEEKHSGKSFRTLANDFHPDLSTEVKQHSDQYSATRFIDVVGSNVCNLQCLPCTSGSFKRDQELYDIGLRTTKPILRNINHIENISDLAIEQLTLCAGEPFFDKQSWQLLELLVTKSKSQQIKLYINTNLTGVSMDRLKWLEENFKEVLIKGSVDGYRSTNDYLRYPCRWSEIDAAVDLILSRPKIQFVITTALSNLSLLTYCQLVDYFLSKGVLDFFISQVTKPQVLHGSNLPDAVKQTVKQDLLCLGARSDLTDRTRDALNLCVALCNDEYPWSPIALADFLAAHDRSRRTNWQNTWPELVDFCA